MSTSVGLRRRLRRIFWILAAAGAVLAGGGYLFWQYFSAPKSSSRGAAERAGVVPPAAGVPVSVEVVRKGNMPVYISAIGTVTPVYTVTVTTRIAGQLLEVHYKEGQIVKKGDLLAVIDPRPYQAALLQAQGQLARDQALLNNSRIDLQRYQAALAQHAVPEQQYATQQATVAQNEGTVQVDVGNIEAAKVNLDYTRITAPIAGRVGLRGVDPGNNIQAFATPALLTITQLQPITVIFTMAEDYISEVQHQVRAGKTLRVDARDREDQHVLAQGTLLTLDNQVDTTTGTVRVRATFPNKRNELFPNEFVNAQLLVRTLRGVSIVPTAAIQRNNEQAFVYVVNRMTNTVQSRNITITNTSGTAAAVNDIKPGETLITEGFDRLADGVKVSIRRETHTANPVPGAAQNAASPALQPGSMTQQPIPMTQPPASMGGTNPEVNPVMPPQTRRSRRK